MLPVVNIIVLYLHHQFFSFQVEVAEWENVREPTNTTRPTMIPQSGGSTNFEARMHFEKEPGKYIWASSLSDLKCLTTFGVKDVKITSEWVLGEKNSLSECTVREYEC